MKQTEQQNLPALRFPGFKEAWKTLKVGDLGPVSMCKRIMKDETKPSGDVPFYKIGTFGRKPDAFIDQETFDRYRERYSFPENGDILISAAGTIGRLVVYDGSPSYFQDSNIVWVANREEKVSNSFLLSCYQNVRWTTEDTTIARLYNDNLRNIDITHPTLPEQRKISEFLGAVDARIAQVTRKKALLANYKKGCIQQLFSQSIRFKDDQGNDFPDWEEKRLGEVLTIGSGKDYKHLEAGEIPVYGTGGLMTHVDEFLYDGESVCIGRKGTIDKPALVEGKFWTVDTLFYTHSFKNALPRFIYAVFQQINWQVHNEASGVPSLSKSTIERLKITLPHPDEQQKIADFLSAIDTKIDLVAQELEQAKTFKKGLLQQMFV